MPGPMHYSYLVRITSCSIRHMRFMLRVPQSKKFPMSQPAMPHNIRATWGKSNCLTGATHHLAHHSADVAAVFCALLEQPIFRRRAERSLGRALTQVEISCLAALVFLHDIGKLAPGFQAKAWPEGHGLHLRGHLECGWLWTAVDPDRDVLAGAGRYLFGWPDLPQWFDAIFAHHGRPVAPPGAGKSQAAFPDLPYYDWRAQEAVMGRALLGWFPEIKVSQPPRPEPPFLHFFCGLLTLADWVGSDAGAFPFVAEFDPGYWSVAQRNAARRVGEIDLGPAPALRNAPGWDLISDHPSPRPAQAAVGALPSDERLVLLEAETGAGKTEAALWRFATLLAAGEVDSLYFAVPTRAAARQLHRRINDTLQTMFDTAPEAVLAIPGQAVAGDATGTRLADFSTRWDDSQAHPARWAAEHSARYLAARVAVGTVDQVALGGLMVKYAHLRGTALSRALLVIDEVHASDPYMSEVQQSLARDHLDLGGHVMLMSATLGAAARRKWRQEAPASLAEDTARAYPAIWTSAGLHPVATDPAVGKTVAVRAQPGWSGEDAASLAAQAARQGARVLVIRNTVARAQETFTACRALASDHLLTVHGIATLHHSRFAAEDRALLDAAVEDAVGKDSPIAGRIVIGTQTLEQSLDLCADLLITDLCPMDVLLQRIGRLHRHRRPRPTGFETAQAIVLCPEGGLDPLTRAADNGLGAYADGPRLSGVYVDMPGIAATLEQIAAHPVWRIPAMNRTLVEAATHPEALDRIAEARGWQDYRARVTGKVLAEMKTAKLVLLDRRQPLECFPDDEKIRTRLGEDGVVLTLPPGTIGAFGVPINRIALPAQWSRGLTGDETPLLQNDPEEHNFIISIKDLSFTYSNIGLAKLDT
ncbi:CRISPR-associated helicase Cas3' [Actibacterium sp. D379-3]